MNIAIIGGGVAGLTAAHILDRQHRITLYEKNNYVGGHTNTVVIPDGPDQGIAVDTGFIVLNNQTYPLFSRLLQQLGVAVRDSEMSFSYYNEENQFQYAGTSVNGLFAQRINLLRPAFYKMLHDITYFNKRALVDLHNGALLGLSLGQYLFRLNFSKAFIHQYLLPMGAAIWSTPASYVMEYPVESFVRFFKNHGLLSLSNRPQWQTVMGGSHSYVKAFLKQFSGEIQLNAQIASVHRDLSGVSMQMRDGSERKYDRVIMAAHADESLKLLADPSIEEQKWLGAWKYSSNHTVLHTDSSVLPPLKRAWASWNYGKEKNTGDNQPVSLTYYMNRLQGLQTHAHYCVTLNRSKPIPANQIIREFNYMHPMYSLAALDSQRKLPALNGVKNTYFCGSYFGYGFHEDAVRSAVDVTMNFGLSL
ncbi:FAD-dependent oxidoreductase [Paenibacillus psychroresistens]|uniref:FAD-dependent oxidoreductase n=1 Tax=Paenibacillus psychroresistens TaxID=1778678 RepID=A0A6B8RX60_9BACL|nr:FAD-dependent oxidoreductase [Paenibacillus psychroresistens]